MSQESYSIPDGPTARYSFQRDVIPLITTNATAWSVPAAKITALATKRASYELKFAAASNKSTKSPSTVAARDASWESLVIDLIDIYNHHLLNNAAIPAADRETLHINKKEGNSGIPTPAPITTPILFLVSEEISVLHAVYSDSATPTSHSKPANVAFCEICYKIGDPAPTTVADCPTHYFISRSHEAIAFPPEMRGKTIHMFARWVNKNSKTGTWSNKISAIIP